jgi:NADPH:quinone reductase-like Zn-dependent oxidoreductase
MKMMRAMSIERQGGPDVFKEASVPVPAPSANQILIKVAATSVNPIDCKLRAGAARIPLALPAILGFDVSGRVVEIGAGVRDFTVGDEVYGAGETAGGHGSYAEYYLLDERIAARKPDNLSHLEAAAMPLAGGTAWEALVSRSRLKVAETVLIHAGAGGVGSHAVQIARACGAVVIATCSADNSDLVRRLGADHTIDYRKRDIIQAVNEATGGRGVDVFFDTVGGETLAQSLEVLKEFGRGVSITNTTGALARAYLKNAELHFVFARRSREKLLGLKNLAERGLLKPVIYSSRPVWEVAEAHRTVDAGSMAGKYVLHV